MPVTMSIFTLLNPNMLFIAEKKKLSSFAQQLGKWLGPVSLKFAAGGAH